MRKTDRRNEVLFAIKTESCFIRDPDYLDWKVSLVCNEKGYFLVGSEIGMPWGRKRRRCRFKVSSAWVASVRKQLESLTVPVAPKFEIGDDGGFTELIYGGYTGKAAYRWWSEPPRGWEPLDRFARKILDRFEELQENAEESK